MRLPARRALPGLALAAILAVTALIYLPRLGAYFVSDDYLYLEIVRRFDNAGDLAPYAQGACTRVGWPVVLFTFWLGHALGGGLQPQTYRLLALGVHLLNAVLVLALVRRVGGGKGSAAALAAVFIVALHPRQNEGVMWLSALAIPIATTFSLALALAYVEWRRSGRLGWLLAALAACALAVFSSPAAVLMPATVAAYDIAQRRWNGRTIAVWAGLAAIAGLLALNCGLGSLGVSRGSDPYGLSLSAGATHAVKFITYMWWPLASNPMDAVSSASLAAYAVFALAGAAIALAGLVILWRGNLLARWGVVWTALALIPCSFYSEAAPDRYMPLMLVGLGLACAGVAQNVTRWPRWAVVALLALAVLTVAQTNARVADWQRAGDIMAAVRDETLARYPSLPPGSRLFFAGVPNAVNRAAVINYNITSAVRLWYGDPTLHAQLAFQRGQSFSPLPGDVIVDLAAR